jgi:mannose-6-phosphate isomerase
MGAPLYPLTFKPIYMERLWGGRALATLYGRKLPSNLPIGESWELSDRPEAVSVIDSGPLEGKDLHALLDEERQGVLGQVKVPAGRFPLLLKILDAREKLSLQVHPPAAVAAQLEGEPKTEIWYVAHAEPGAALFVGLRKGVVRAEFEERLRTGTVAECFHRLPIKAGDAMFVPSGRVHAIGGGSVLFEIQQNSDTTYRVFDWNRVGLDGKPRALHIPESLASIDFNDYEPALLSAQFEGREGMQVRSLVRCAEFEVEARRADPGARQEITLGDAPVILGMVQGEIKVMAGEEEVRVPAGRFCLVPAGCGKGVVETVGRAEYLVVRPG